MSSVAVKTAWVTGAARGIGAAIANELGRAGMRLVLVDKEQEALATTLSTLSRMGVDAHGVTLDLADTRRLKQNITRAAQGVGPADVLVNNAGVAAWGLADAFPEDAWRLTMSINLDAPFQLTQAFLPHMRERKWGRIVNVASVSGLLAGTGRLAYGTSKAALIALSRQIAVESAAWGVTCNAVAPGAVETDMVRQFHTDVDRQRIISRVPAGRYGSPDHIAAAVGFLVSDQAEYVNGHVLAVDGGFTSAGFLLPTDR